MITELTNIKMHSARELYRNNRRVDGVNDDDDVGLTVGSGYGFVGRIALRQDKNKRIFSQGEGQVIKSGRSKSKDGGGGTMTTPASFLDSRRRSSSSGHKLNKRNNKSMGSITLSHPKSRNIGSKLQHGVYPGGRVTRATPSHLNESR